MFSGIWHEMYQYIYAFQIINNYIPECIQIHAGDAGRTEIEFIYRKHNLNIFSFFVEIEYNFMENKNLIIFFVYYMSAIKR